MTCVYLRWLLLILFSLSPVPLEKGNAGSGNKNGIVTSTLHVRERAFLTVWPLEASRHKLASVLLSLSYGHAQDFSGMAFLQLALNLRLPYWGLNFRPHIWRA